MSLRAGVTPERKPQIFIYCELRGTRPVRDDKSEHES